ncbi:hypothetical protein BpHYR1_009703 [Brachionus plicatilis]|uniref:Uncharacterized protein n=1 Tax=Brachionus plicatilis TaxID=10195 RepID=A0A3M7P0Q6_BRAPC|nr:hypothetical protein BpHYR1_009703 [Brachionus plicatilis]
MVGDKWHSINGGDKYGSVFYLKTGGPCFINIDKKFLLLYRKQSFIYASNEPLFNNKCVEILMGLVQKDYKISNKISLSFIKKLRTSIIRKFDYNCFREMISQGCPEARPHTTFLFFLWIKKERGKGEKRTIFRKISIQQSMLCYVVVFFQFWPPVKKAAGLNGVPCWPRPNFIQKFTKNKTKHSILIFRLVTSHLCNILKKVLIAYKDLMNLLNKTIDKLSSYKTTNVIIIHGRLMSERWHGWLQELSNTCQNAYHIFDI